MSGKFNKAPLVYVSAKIKTTSLRLTVEQKIAISQAMIRCGLPYKEEASYKEFEIKSFDEPNQSISYKDEKQLVGFFSVNRTEALIMDEDYIEWRTTAYDTFAIMSARVDSILDSLTNAVDVISEIYIEELELSYADLIYPINTHTLKDYFNKGDEILPLNFIHCDKDDLVSSGRIEVSRIVRKNLKMNAEFEQIPFKDTKIQQSIPRSMLERIPNFTMPVEIKHDEPNPKASHYGVLGTSASSLRKEKLGQIKFEKIFTDLHRLIDDAFKALINREVCDVDWEWENL